MPQLDESSETILETDGDDQRIGHLMGQAMDEGEVPRVGLIGFPSDQQFPLCPLKPGSCLRNHCQKTLAQRGHSNTKVRNNKDSMKDSMGSHV
jgi:hypothetical protein